MAFEEREVIIHINTGIRVPFSDLTSWGSAHSDYTRYHFLAEHNSYSANVNDLWTSCKLNNISISNLEINGVRINRQEYASTPTVGIPHFFTAYPANDLYQERVYFYWPKSKYGSEYITLEAGTKIVMNLAHRYAQKPTDVSSNFSASFTLDNRVLYSIPTRNHNIVTSLVSYPTFADGINLQSTNVMQTKNSYISLNNFGNDLEIAKPEYELIEKDVLAYSNNVCFFRGQVIGVEKTSKEFRLNVATEINRMQSSITTREGEYAYGRVPNLTAISRNPKTDEATVYLRFQKLNDDFENKVFFLHPDDCFVGSANPTFPKFDDATLDAPKSSGVITENPNFELIPVRNFSNAFRSSVQKRTIVDFPNPDTTTQINDSSELTPNSKDLSKNLLEFLNQPKEYFGEGDRFEHKGFYLTLDRCFQFSNVVVFEFKQIKDFFRQGLNLDGLLKFKVKRKNPMIAQGTHFSVGSLKNKWVKAYITAIADYKITVQFFDNEIFENQFKPGDILYYDKKDPNKNDVENATNNNDDGNGFKNPWLNNPINIIAGTLARITGIANEQTFTGSNFLPSKLLSNPHLYKTVKVVAVDGTIVVLDKKDIFSVGDMIARYPLQGIEYSDGRKKNVGYPSGVSRVDISDQPQKGRAVAEIQTDLVGPNYYFLSNYDYQKDRLDEFPDCNFQIDRLASRSSFIDPKTNEAIRKKISYEGYDFEWYDDLVFHDEYSIVATTDISENATTNYEKSVAEANSEVFGRINVGNFILLKARDLDRNFQNAILYDHTYTGEEFSKKVGYLYDYTYQGVDFVNEKNKDLKLSSALTNQRVGINLEIPCIVTSKKTLPEVNIQYEGGDGSKHTIFYLPRRYYFSVQSVQRRPLWAYYSVRRIDTVKDTPIPVRVLFDSDFKIPKAADQLKFDTYGIEQTPPRAFKDILKRTTNINTTHNSFCIGYDNELLSLKGDKTTRAIDLVNHISTSIESAITLDPTNNKANYFTTRPNVLNIQQITDTDIISYELNSSRKIPSGNIEVSYRQNTETYSYTDPNVRAYSLDAGVLSRNLAVYEKNDAIGLAQYLLSKYRNTDTTFTIVTNFSKNTIKVGTPVLLNSATYGRFKLMCVDKRTDGFYITFTFSNVYNLYNQVLLLDYGETTFSDGTSTTTSYEFDCGKSDFNKPSPFVLDVKMARKSLTKTFGDRPSVPSQSADITITFSEALYISGIELNVSNFGNRGDLIAIHSVDQQGDAVDAHTQHRFEFVSSNVIKLTNIGFSGGTLYRIQIKNSSNLKDFDGNSITASDWFMTSAPTTAPVLAARVNSYVLNSTNQNIPGLADTSLHTFTLDFDQPIQFQDGTEITKDNIFDKLTITKQTTYYFPVGREVYGTFMTTSGYKETAQTIPASRYPDDNTYTVSSVTTDGQDIVFDLPPLETNGAYIVTLTGSYKNYNNQNFTGNKVFKFTAKSSDTTKPTLQTLTVNDINVKNDSYVSDALAPQVGRASGSDFIIKMKFSEPVKLLTDWDGNYYHDDSRWSGNPKPIYTDIATFDNDGVGYDITNVYDGNYPPPAGTKIYRKVFVGTELISQSSDRRSYEFRMTSHGNFFFELQIYNFIVDDKLNFYTGNTRFKFYGFYTDHKDARVSSVEVGTTLLSVASRPATNYDNTSADFSKIVQNKTAIPSLATSTIKKFINVTFSEPVNGRKDIKRFGPDTIEHLTSNFSRYIWLKKLNGTNTTEVPITVTQVNNDYSKFTFLPTGNWEDSDYILVMWIRGIRDIETNRNIDTAYPFTNEIYKIKGHPQIKGTLDDQEDGDDYACWFFNQTTREVDGGTVGELQLKYAKVLNNSNGTDIFRGTNTFLGLNSEKPIPGDPFQTQLKFTKISFRFNHTIELDSGAVTFSGAWSNSNVNVLNQETPDLGHIIISAPAGGWQGGTQASPVNYTFTIHPEKIKRKSDSTSKFGLSTDSKSYTISVVTSGNFNCKLTFNRFTTNISTTDFSNQTFSRVEGIYFAKKTHSNNGVIYVQNGVNLNQSLTTHISNLTSTDTLNYDLLQLSNSDITNYQSISKNQNYSWFWLPRLGSDPRIKLFMPKGSGIAYGFGYTPGATLKFTFSKAIKFKLSDGSDEEITNSNVKDIFKLFANDSSAYTQGITEADVGTSNWSGSSITIDSTKKIVTFTYSSNPKLRSHFWGSTLTSIMFYMLPITGLNFGTTKRIVSIDDEELDSQVAQQQFGFFFGYNPNQT